MTLKHHPQRMRNGRLGSKPVLNIPGESLTTNMSDNALSKATNPHRMKSSLIFPTYACTKWDLFKVQCNSIVNAVSGEPEYRH